MRKLRKYSSTPQLDTRKDFEISWIKESNEATRTPVVFLKKRIIKRGDEENEDAAPSGTADDASGFTEITGKDINVSYMNENEFYPVGEYPGRITSNTQFYPGKEDANELTVQPEDEIKTVEFEPRWHSPKHIHMVAVKKAAPKVKHLSYWGHVLNLYERYPLPLLKTSRSVFLIVLWFGLLIWASDMLGTEFHKDRTELQKYHAVCDLKKTMRYHVAEVRGDKYQKNVRMIVRGPFDSSATTSTFTPPTSTSLKISFERWWLPQLNVSALKAPAKNKIYFGTSKDLPLVDVSTTKTYTHDNNPYDYNKTPVEVLLEIKSDNLTGLEYPHYIISFSIDGDNSSTLYVPFSFEYNVRNDKGPAIMFLPLMVYAITNLIQIHRALCACFGLAVAAVCYVDVGFTPSLYKTYKLLDFDWLFFVFACSVFTALLAETNVHSFLAWYWLKYSKWNLLYTQILIQVLPIIPCLYFNNVAVASFLLLFFVRVFEIMGHDPIPAIINLLMVCNIYGKSYVGNYEAWTILNDQNTKETIEDEGKLLKYMMPTTVTVGAFVSAAWMGLYHYGRPLRNRKLLKEQENEQLIAKTDIIAMSMLDVSKHWHSIRMKLVDLKLFFEHESKEAKAMTQKFHPEPKTFHRRLMEISSECKIHNWMLCAKLMMFSVLCLVIFMPPVFNLIFDVEYFQFCFGMKFLHVSAAIKSKIFKIGYPCVFPIVIPIIEADFSGIAFSFGLGVTLCVAPRELELLLKRVDWEAIVIFTCLSGMANMFKLAYKSFPYEMWDTHGVNLTLFTKSDLKESMNTCLYQILAYTSISTVYNDHTVFDATMDVGLLYSKNVNDSLYFYLPVTSLATCFWGMSSPIGTAVNIVGTGLLAQHGLITTISLYKFMRYGLPFSVLAIVVTGVVMFFNIQGRTG